MYRDNYCSWLWFLDYSQHVFHHAISDDRHWTWILNRNYFLGYKPMRTDGELKSCEID